VSQRSGLPFAKYKSSMNTACSYLFKNTHKAKPKPNVSLWLHRVFYPPKQSGQPHDVPYISQWRRGSCTNKLHSLGVGACNPSPPPPPPPGHDAAGYSAVAWLPDMIGGATIHAIMFIDLKINLFWKETNNGEHVIQLFPPYIIEANQATGGTVAYNCVIPIKYAWKLIKRSTYTF
jgi:hypothetical protein